MILKKIALLSLFLFCFTVTPQLTYAQNSAPIQKKVTQDKKAKPVQKVVKKAPAKKNVVKKAPVKNGVTKTFEVKKAPVKKDTTKKITVKKTLTTNASTKDSLKIFTVTGTSFAFAPSALEVALGDKVKIMFKNEEGFHDWKLDEFNAATEKIQEGKTTEVTFTADKKGEFEYYCSVGKHREMGMKGTLTVK